MFRLGIHQRGAVRSAGELPVELRHEMVQQRQFGGGGDPEADEGEDDDLPDEQP